jgi:hypothetical protein
MILSMEAIFDELLEIIAYSFTVNIAKNIFVFLKNEKINHCGLQDESLKFSILYSLI